MAGPVDLGLALTLESHVQINKLFVDEVTRDMDSPSDAKFQYSIPRIKKELLSMEQCLHKDKKLVGSMISSLNDVVRSGEVYYQQVSGFANTLFEFGTQTRTNDPIVGNGIMKIGQVITQISTHLRTQITSMRNMCATSLEVLFENDLKGGKYKSHVDSAVGQYESARQRVEREEREELRKKGVPNWKEKSYMPEELAGKLEQDRRTFQIKAVEYMVRVLDVRYKRGIEFADHLLQYMGVQRGYFQDCSLLLDVLKEWESRFSAQLTEQRTKHEEERKRLQSLREKVKSSMGISKHLDNRVSMLPSVSSTDSTSKTGNLLMKPRNAILKLARRRWQKVFCTANLNGFSVANSHTHAPHIQVPVIHYQCKDVPETEGHKYCFQLLTHTGSYIFDTESEMELKEWKSVIHHCQIVLFTDGPTEQKIKRQRTFQRTGLHVHRDTKAELNYFQTVVKDLIKTIKRLPGNQLCCDCSAPDPEWLSVNLGVLICIECSGQHRDLSVQFSRIRSIKLDDLHTSELLVARVMGNHLLNEVMEATLPSDDKPGPKSTIDAKKEFIHNKYLHKKFIEPSPTDVNYTVQHILREAVDSRDIRNLLQVYVDGADMCASLPDRSDNFNALHLAVEQEDMTTLHIVEFIASNSRAIEHQDIKGDTPLHLASVMSSYHCLQLLLTKRPDFSLVNKSNQTALDIAVEENNDECLQLIKDAKKGKFKKCENIDIDWGVEDPEENEGLYCSPEDLAAAKNQAMVHPHTHKHIPSRSTSSVSDFHSDNNGQRYGSIKRNISAEPISSPSTGKQAPEQPKTERALQSPPRPPPVPPRQAIVTALYSCSPDQPDELAFQEGDKIVIVKKHSEDWWEGYVESLPSKRGVFPSNYVSEH